MGQGSHSPEQGVPLPSLSCSIEIQFLTFSLYSASVRALLSPHFMQTCVLNNATHSCPVSFLSQRAAVPLLLIFLLPLHGKHPAYPRALLPPAFCLPFASHHLSHHSLLRAGFPCSAAAASLPSTVQCHVPLYNYFRAVALSAVQQLF